MTLLLYGLVNQAVNIMVERSGGGGVILFLTYPLRSDLLSTPFLYLITCITIIPLNPNFRNNANVRPGKTHTSGLNGQNKSVTCIGIDYHSGHSE